MIALRTLPQTILDTALRVPQEVLNLTTPTPPIPTPTALDSQLKHLTGRLKAEAIDPTTSTINYRHLRNNPLYAEYRALTTHLPAFDLHTLTTRAQKLAFWLNLYNALVIDSIIAYGIRASVNEVPGFFRRVAYAIGGYRFSLDDIEHGILRANAGHIVIPGPQFARADPRRTFILHHLDWRIHFALVCGARSCPPINFYTEDKIDAQLDLAAANFLGQSTTFDPARRTLHLSKLLQWYGTDFGAGPLSALGFGNYHAALPALAPHLSDPTLRELCSHPPRDLKIRFTPYDWSLNTT